jgi:hypothetical protein
LNGFVTCGFDNAIRPDMQQLLDVIADQRAFRQPTPSLVDLIGPYAGCGEPK